MVTLTHEAGPGTYSAVVRATKPADATGATAPGRALIDAVPVAEGAQTSCSTESHAACCDSFAKGACCGQTSADASVDGPPAACGCR